MVGLEGDSLIYYDELEALFYQTMLEQGVPWFQRFGGDEPLDDSRDISDYCSPVYREKIIQNAVSIFDFRLYLFSHQFRALKTLNHREEMCRRGLLFIRLFSQSLYFDKVNILLT